MLKTERIKKKVGGKKQEVRVEEIQRRDRMERFVSINCSTASLFNSIHLYNHFNIIKKVVPICSD